MDQMSTLLFTYYHELLVVLLHSASTFSSAKVGNWRSSHIDVPFSLNLTKCFSLFLCECSTWQTVTSSTSVCVCRLCMC